MRRSQPLTLFRFLAWGVLCALACGCTSVLGDFGVATQAEGGAGPVPGDSAAIDSTTGGSDDATVGADAARDATASGDGTVGADGNGDATASGDSTVGADGNGDANGSGDAALGADTAGADATVRTDAGSRDGSPTADGNGGDGSATGLNPDGTTCASDAECLHGHCADKVCCDQACSGICETCNQAATLGVCKPVPANQDPRGVCPAGTGANAICQPGKCNGANQCNAAMPGTACAAAACSSGAATSAGMCAANGPCQIPAAMACSPYVCGATACAKPCSADTDCVAGYYCLGGACLARKTQGGGPCTVDTECQAGLSCSPEGICCNSPCNGSCQVCDTSGTCVAVPSSQQPRPGHPACTNGGSSPCGGYCDGVDVGCYYPTVQCSAAACGCYSGHCQSSPAQNCANGSCPGQVITSCNGFACDSTGTTCQQTCDATSGTSAGCYFVNCCHAVFTGVCFYSCTSTCPSSSLGGCL